jgi:putative Mg2+ transporter-C (MgtC) family protein
VVDEWDIALRVLVAALLGGLVGFDRLLADKPAGIRTHMLVAAGSALFVGTSVLLSFDVETTGSEGARIDVSRVTAGVVAGVGFLGAGSIIRHRGEISGLTTAAGIWVVAAIGAAIAFGFWIVGIAATLMVLIIHAGQYLDGRLRARGRDIEPGD